MKSGSGHLCRLPRTSGAKARIFLASNRHDWKSCPSRLCLFRGDESPFFHGSAHSAGRSALPSRDSRGGCPYVSIVLRGFAGALAFERLLATYVDLNLLRFSFGLLGQT